MLAFASETSVFGGGGGGGDGESRSIFATMLVRLGGEDQLKALMEPVLQKYAVMKAVKSKDLYYSRGYGHLAEGMVEVFGNEEEIAAANGQVGGRDEIQRAPVSKGYADEVVAYRAMNIALSPDPILRAAFSPLVERDFDFYRLIFSGSHNGIDMSTCSMDGTWIWPTVDPMAFECICQERGNISSRKNISKAEFIDRIINDLFIIVSKFPKQRRYVEKSMLARDHPSYAPQFKALAMGIPRQIVVRKLEVLKLDVGMLDTPDRVITVREVLEEDRIYTSIFSENQFYVID